MRLASFYVACATAMCFFSWTRCEVCNPNKETYASDNLTEDERKVLKVAEEHSLSGRCVEKLLEDLKDLVPLRDSQASSFRKIVNSCPRGLDQGQGLSGISPKQSRIRREHGEVPIVVFAWLLHSDPTLALRSAELLMDERLDMKTYVQFHVDASAEDSVHAKVKEFVDANPSRASVVSSVDVEWGEFSFNKAQFRIMKDALRKWKDWNNIAFLSGEDMVLGSRATFNRYFVRHSGLNHFGSALSAELEGSKTIWQMQINDMLVSCDNVTISLGPRKRLIKYDELTEMGKLFMGNTQGVFSRDFVSYLSSKIDPNLASLQTILRYSASSDESYWPSIFFNSPLCEQHVRHSHDREYFLYFWPLFVKSNFRMKGAECRVAELQDPKWLCGLRPRYLSMRDLPRLMFYPDTLFVRKVNYKNSKDLVDEVYKWINEDKRPRPKDAGVRFRIKFNNQCLTSISSDPPSFQLSEVGCLHELSIFTAICSGPLSVKRKENSNEICISSISGEGNAPSMCEITPVKHKLENCLATKDKEYEPGMLVGLRTCHEYREGQVFSFEPGRCSVIRHAARITNDMYAQGLCIIGTEDSSALRFVTCDKVSSTKNSLKIQTFEA